MFLLDGKRLPLDKAFTHAGVQYPKNWLRLTTLAEKEAIGITEVPDTSNPSYNQQFYWGYDADNNLIPKQLNDEPVLDEDGNDTGEITTGLKTLWKAKQSEIAASLLAPSDWRVIKAKETSSTMPAAWKTYRAAVRTACNARQAEIDACADVPALIELLFGAATIQQQQTDDDGNLVTETVTLQRQQTDDDGNGIVDDDGNPVMEDYTEERPVMETVANPAIATAWPEAI